MLWVLVEEVGLLMPLISTVATLTLLLILLLIEIDLLIVVLVEFL